MKVTTRILILLLAGLLTQYGRADDRQVAGCEYWFDNNLSSLRTINGTTEFTADASSLGEGLHTLHYRAKASDGRYSPVQSWMFYRIGKKATGVTTKLEYWIDNRSHSSINVNDTTVNFMLNAASEAEGLHTLHYRLTSTNGTASPVQSWMFYRTGKSSVGDLKLEYWIDNGSHRSLSANDSTVVFMLNAASESEGLHTLHYRLTSTNGTASPVQSWMFYRMSAKPKATRLKSYRIWWNNHQDKAVEVAVPDSSATQLLYDEVLAVPSYARNDGYSSGYEARFHIVFIDDQGNRSAVETATVSYPDVFPPQPTLTATQKAGTNMVELTWKADKKNIKDYNVYYSENGEPFILWLPNTTRQQATFSGQQGTTYRFVVTARDDKGNYEAIEEPKAQTVEIR
jgi:hypothetical protein